MASEYEKLPYWGAMVLFDQVPHDPGFWTEQVAGGAGGRGWEVGDLINV